MFEYLVNLVYQRGKVNLRKVYFLWQFFFVSIFPPFFPIRPLARKCDVVQLLRAVRAKQIHKLESIIRMTE